MTATLSAEERNRLRAREWARANPGRVAARVKAWREENPEKFKAQRTAHRAKNKEKLAAAAKSRRRKPRVRDRSAEYERYKEKMLAANKAWRAANRDKHAAAQQAREAAKLKATPPWANARLTAAVYFAADVTGSHVDHIVPLKGKNVCGLHWRHNLQLLAPKDNQRKHAKFDPDTYVHELPGNTT